ncbi:E3 ubiquitin-protein ligase RNF26-like [Platichthys flesus]|uniref:E3 ubiquitin-protein ligase RNF26-like n=1 Tax=Platichthys flesus TaxID=8260 RepID=UPI002DBC9B37|nr:E3 ubiquitin-protein ligase RNF26-like [Platichthys flesus]
MFLRHVAAAALDEVNVVLTGVWRCVDVCCLLLIATLGRLLHFLSGVCVSLRGSMVGRSGSTLVEYWNFALFSFLTATEAVSCAAHGALHAMEDWLQMLGGVLESFKMVGHLFCHMAWRMKDMLQRGFTLACCILRQTCEGVLIALSLILYFVNTVVNVMLISTQNCLSVLAGVWEAVAGPVHKVVDLALTLLTFLYSCLVGASVLLWTPCQLLLDFLEALGRVFVTVFVVDSHGLLATVAIISLTLLVLNPRLPVLAGQLSLRLVNALPGVHGVQAAMCRLYAAMVEPARAQRAARTGTAEDRTRTRLLNTDAGGLTSQDRAPRGNALSQPDAAPHLARQDGEPACGGRTRTSQSNSAAEDGELLHLLNEQEERKKCVICHDFNKTVLLLPCRHLCLCRHCADILTERRPVPQRCCPLCRQSITQTLDVFL